MRAASVIMIMLLAPLVQVRASRASRQPDDEAEAETMIGLMPGEAAQHQQGQGSEIFVVQSITLDELLDDDDDDNTPEGEGPAATEVAEGEGPAATDTPEEPEVATEGIATEGEPEPEEAPPTTAPAPAVRDGGKTSFIIEMRSKIRFKGNKIELRNPEMVPALVQDIKNQKANHPDSKFVFCLHVGTSAGEAIKTKRKGFMEGRVKTLADALTAEDGELEVGSNVFEHYDSTRFAGLVMKVYNGEEAPECNKEDLVPPSK